MFVTHEISTEQISSHSLLSRDAILKHIKRRSVVIDPYNPDQLKTGSYDVKLGENYYRGLRHAVSYFYNPWGESSVRRYWGEPLKAESGFELSQRLGYLPENVKPDDKIIVFSPGELILGHTEEFIGGRVIATSMMKARSSIGRNGFTVCKCAGWGDVGYINRWTMEIKNELPCNNFLIVGEAVAQITLFEVDPVKGDYALEGGKYQRTTDMELLKKTWTPEQMLPKLWMDRQK